jgi:hypothetical protein
MIAWFPLLASAWVSTDEMGTLSVTVDAAPYRGRRVRVRGQVHGDIDGDWSGLWLRVDGRESVATFDTTLERSETEAGWLLHTVDLDVGPNAKTVAFGVILSGNQTVRIDDLSLEDVGRARTRTEQGRARRTKRRLSARSTGGRTSPSARP